MPTQLKDLEAIKTSISTWSVGSSDNFVVARGDSLEVLRSMPDQSISLILTDPPYHSTKKDNIYGDKAFSEDEEFLNWMELFAMEFARLLKPNGSAYVFCSPQMSGQLEVMFSRYLKPLNHITWTKPNDPGFDGWKGKMNKSSLKRWYPHSERILFFEAKSDDPAHRSTLGKFLRDCRLKCEMTSNKLNEVIGEYGAVNHGGAVSNWEIGRNVPSREQYRKICDAFLSTKKISSMPLYEEVVRAFNASEEYQYTDVWDFPSVRPYRGKHPAEKPLDMLRQIVEVSSFAGDIVLDCFAGSGSTGVASLNLGRRPVLIDIEEQWSKRSLNRLTEATLFENSSVTPIKKYQRKKAVAAETLFD